VNQLMTHLQTQVMFRRQLTDTDRTTYSCVEDYVLDRGTSYDVSASLTPEELGILLDAVDTFPGRLRQKRCFHNAQMLALFERRLDYVEGVAVGRSGFPVHHGWLALNGKVIDVTWRTDKPNHRGRLRDRVFGVIPDGWAYRGVAFPRAEILRRFEDHPCETRAFLGDWKRGFPYLKQTRLEA
jgi:hypothetical protein